MLYSVDRFEGDVAVLIDEDGNRRDILRSVLPHQVKAGDMLREEDGVFTPDNKASEDRRARALRLQDSLLRRHRR